jgi:small subunit ribosomal protein S16
MAVKIRLRAQGSVNRVKYRVVVADSRSPRDGKYLEAVGWYHPMAKDEDKKVFLLPDRIQHWLLLGAEITDKVESLMKKAAPGVLQAYKAKNSAKALKDAKKRREQNKKEAKAKPAKPAKAKAKAEPKAKKAAPKAKKAAE